MIDTPEAPRKTPCARLANCLSSARSACADDSPTDPDDGPEGTGLVSRLRLDDGTVSRWTPEIGRIAARLTARDVEVLRLVAQGMSNNEIAQKLFISPKTASVHVSRSLTKPAVNSRAKATVIAYEERLLSDVN